MSRQMLTAERSMSVTTTLDRQNSSQEIQTITPPSTEELQNQQQQQRQLTETKSIQLHDINTLALPSYANLTDDNQTEKPPVYDDLFREPSLSADDSWSWLDRV